MVGLNVSENKIYKKWKCGLESPHFHLVYLSEDRTDKFILFQADQVHIA